MERKTVCAIICEYDPFHNGHRYQIEEARKRSGADYVLCLMSGCVTQRGSFARYDPSIRTASALKAGADVVLELPARYACGAAPEFAGGAVRILELLGVCDFLSFGCESALIPRLEHIVPLLRRETPEFQDRLHAYQALGQPYPSAYAAALADQLNMPDLKTQLNAPNAILALQYLKALPDTMIPLPVERIGSFHDHQIGEYSSASALRLSAESGTLEQAQIAFSDPEPYLAAERQQWIHEPDALSQLLLYHLRTDDPQHLAHIHGMAEGLHLRFISSAKKAGTRKSLLSLVKTRRYTYTRLSRITTCILLDLTSSIADKTREPEYVRLLGFRTSAQPLLHLIKTSSQIPLIARSRDFPQNSLLFQLDHRAQELWSLGCSNPDYRKSGQDMTRQPVILQTD